MAIADAFVDLNEMVGAGIVSRDAVTGAVAAAACRIGSGRSGRAVMRQRMGGHDADAAAAALRDAIIKGKAAGRCERAALSWGEKLEIIGRLRERDDAFKANRARNAAEAARGRQVGDADA